jgi:gamma-glutamylcyclotransferase (GGCT)/AIG2-like uncharacterized protein YtfP
LASFAPLGELSLANPDHRLIVYGTLAPGGMYHYLLADLPGVWERCVIRGYMREYWGFMAFQYDEKGPEHQAWLLTSPALPEMFPELDAFEGEPYRRLIIPARVGLRRVLAHIYERKYLE